ncbi:MAG: S-layer homology domain-containing protein [Eubacteriales bacterium]
MKKRKILCLFAAAVLIFAAVFTVLPASAAQETAIVSPALYILANENGMAMAGLRGHEIAFEKNDFARALNMSGVTSITVTSVPDDGKLIVGTTVVNKGQKITGNNIALMKFVADSSNVTESSFTFRADNAQYDVKCTLYMLDQINYAPTLSLAPETSLNVATHKNITLYGKLSAYDPDGDDCMIEIVSYPKSGILILTDKSTGEYTYTPGANYTGKDSFTYVARDKYGNYSASSEVSLSVNKPSAAVSFSDMTDSPAHNAALTMTEAGIMSGTQVGDGYYFYPAQTVSRVEFLVMAMKSVGIDNVAAAETTVFADDADIPSSMKGYVKTAYDLGYIKGSYDGTELCFRPDAPITKAEAAVMVGRMIDAATPTVTPTFSDADDIPSWARNSVYSLNALGILEAQGTQISSANEMTRADTARMLCALMRVVK